MKRQRKEDEKEEKGEMGTLQSFEIIASLPIWTGVNGLKIASVYKRRTEKEAASGTLLFLISFGCHMWTLEIGYSNNVGLETISLQKDEDTSLRKSACAHVGLISLELSGESSIKIFAGSVGTPQGASPSPKVGVWKVDLNLVNS